MEGMCTGCLSTGRKLFFIGETGYYHLYSQIMNEIPVYDLSTVCVRICWECRARLRGMQLFKQQVKRNLADLLQQLPLQATSSLSRQLQFSMSYPEVKDESDVTVVKCESLEHCEPEPFARALSVQQDIGTGEKNAKPLKKKKKPRIKLKSTNKIKVKKKRKKQQFSDNILATEDNLAEESTDYVDDNVEESHNEESHINDVKESHIESNCVKEETEVKPEVVPTEVKLPRVRSSNGVKRTRNMESLPDRPQCQECGKVFSSKKTYRYHLNVLHKGQNQYPCPRCGKVYQWKSNLGRHMRSHRAVDDGELYCSLCDKSFASVATYRQHLRISRRHVPETEFSFACDECGKRFVNKTRLRDHVDWEHLNRIKFRCQLCDKPFKCHTSLYVHTQNVHIGKERKDNLCHVCGKSYQNAAKLKYHITAMHSGETPYRCVQCAAAFGWYSSLYRHMREVHYKMKGAGKKTKKLKPRVEPAQAHYAPL